MEYRHFLTYMSVAGLLLISAVVQADKNITTTLSNMYTVPFSLSAASPNQTIIVPVSTSNQLVVGIESENTAIDIAVTDPTGAPIDTAAVERYTITPGDEPPLGAVLFSAGEHITFTIDNPIPGNWSVELSLPTTVSTDVNGALTRFTIGGLSSRLLTSRSSYREDQDVVLSALVFNDATPVTGATVLADVFTEANVLVPELSGLNLQDNGITPDVAAGDGIYTVKLPGAIPGHYFAEANITAGSDKAVATTQFEVNSTLASFTGSVSDTGFDANGDGLFDHIVLQFGVAVIEPGTYDIIAILKKNEKSVIAGSQTVLDAITTQVDVIVPADDIKGFLTDNGPYDIAEVQMIKRASSADDIDVVADQLTNLGQTQAYALTQLQRPITLIPEGLTESANDHDANGLYDTLEVTFTIDSLTPSSYTWSGDVRTADGQVLGVANSGGYLSAGANSVTLTFNGHDIGKGGINGPYQIANIAAYGNNGGANVRDLLGETRPYLVSEFEGGTATFAILTKEVTELVITGIGGVPRAEGIRTSLLQKLEKAEMLFVEKDRINAAANLVDAFSNEVAAQSGHHIRPDDAERLIDLAHQLAASITAL